MCCFWVNFELWILGGGRWCESLEVGFWVWFLCIVFVCMVDILFLVGVGVCYVCLFDLVSVGSLVFVLGWLSRRCRILKYWGIGGWLYGWCFFVGGGDCKKLIVFVRIVIIEGFWVLVGFRCLYLLIVNVIWLMGFFLVFLLFYWKV